MIDIDDLRVGDLVRLSCGSPRMVVEGFAREPAPPGYPEGRRRWVKVVVWSDRLGVVREDLPAILLDRWIPRTVPAGEPAP